MPKSDKTGIQATSIQEDGHSQLSVVQETQETLLPAIPSPKSMKEYEEIHPGFTDRVLKLAEKQQEKMIEMSEKNSARDYELAKRAQYLAGIIAAMLFGSVAYGFYSEFDYSAAILAGIGVALSVIFGILKR